MPPSETESLVFMAKVLGGPGRYVSQEATILRRKMWNRVGLGIGALGVIAGLAVGSSFRLFSVSPWLAAPVVVAALLAMWLVAHRCFRRLDELERTQDHFRQGAAGEALVGLVLENFPDEFRVVNDLVTPSGNLDHVIIGPTGVFVVDTKDWRGVVAADDHGELTCNGQKVDRPYVRRFIARVMDVKDNVQALASGVDTYFHPVFVFTSAHVEAKFGSTRTVHCIREDQLFDYVVNNESARELSPEAVETISQAFLGLPHMDSGSCGEGHPVDIHHRGDGSRRPLEPLPDEDPCLAGSRA